MGRHFKASVSHKKDHRSQMRHGIIFVLATILLSIHLIGCATVERPPSEAIMGYPPNVQIGEELTFFNFNEWDPYGVTSLIDTDGRAHVFAIDSNDQLNHIEILGDNSITIESLGLIEKEDDVVLIDAIEHPVGTIRVLASDKQYIRTSPDSGWREMEGNRCARFVSGGDDLFCAFVTKGEEISTPKRKDVTAGLFVILPLFWWKNVDVAKLVLAQETTDGWVIKAVFDQDTDRDANNGFIMGCDNNGKIHFLYYTSKGGSWWWFMAGGYSADLIGGSLHSPELRYAQVDIAQLSQQDTADTHDQSLTQEMESKVWIPVNGTTLTYLPFADSIKYGYTEEYDLYPLLNDFAVNKVTGDIEGFMRRDITEGFLKDYFAYLDIAIHEGQWSPSYRIIDFKEFVPEEYGSIYARILTLKKDLKGNSHILTYGTKGFWNNECSLSYLVKEDNKWSDPLMLGNYCFRYPLLAVDQDGLLFATYVNREGKLTGRWIRPRTDNHQ